MKRRHAVLLGVVLVAGALGVIGCERALPTEPDRGVAAMRPKASPPPAAGSPAAGRAPSPFTRSTIARGGFLSAPCDGPQTIASGTRAVKRRPDRATRNLCGRAELRGHVVGEPRRNPRPRRGRASERSPARCRRLASRSSPSRPSTTRTTTAATTTATGAWSADVMLHPQDGPRAHPILAGGGRPAELRSSTMNGRRT